MKYYINLYYIFRATPESPPPIASGKNDILRRTWKSTP